MHQVRCRSHVSGRHAWTDETNCQNAGGSAAACDDPVWAKGATSGTQASVVLVNGMTQPVISLEANKWYRFRMVFAAVDAVITPWVDGCTIQVAPRSAPAPYRAVAP